MTKEGGIFCCPEDRFHVVVATLVDHYYFTSSNNVFVSLFCLKKKHHCFFVLHIFISYFYLQRIVESPNISMCMNELLTLEYGEVQSRLKLSACKAVFSALDNVSDAVEISSDDHEIQVAINM